MINRNEIMEDAYLFSDIKLNEKPLNECELVLECNHNHYRLYIDKSEYGFFALAVGFHSCESSEDIWLCPALQVDKLVSVTAYFDGVRHLEFDRESADMAGYIYYPDMKGLVEIFQKIRELELKYCWDCEKD